MLAPRWRKVLADLWGNKTRTLLTALTIAVGLFAVGFVSSLSDIMLPDMMVDYLAVNPHSAILYCDPFDDTLLTALRQVPGVAEVEGRSSASGRMTIDQSGKKINLNIIGLPPLEKMHLDRLRPVNPGDSLAIGDREVLIESSALTTIPTLTKGSLLRVELQDGRIRELRIAGFARDVTVIPAHWGMNAIYVYVSPKTIEWLGGTQDYTQLYFTVTDHKKDKAHVEAVARALADKLEKGGRTVYYTWVYNPGRHFSADITQGIAAIMGVMGGLSVFLSIFLILNTLNALLTQHIRQIGIMKAVGGQTRQIICMYLALVAGFGLLALLPTVPLSGVLSYQVSEAMSHSLNFKLQGFRIPPQTILQQAVLALGVPLVAALFPVISGTRLTIRQALATYGLGQGRFGKSRVDQWVERIRFLSRPMLVSLRNTFRRKTRLVLTLITLTLGGASFIAVFNLRTALLSTLGDIEGYFIADVNFYFARDYRFAKLQALAQLAPGVAGLEGWGYSSGQLLSPDKQTATEVGFIAPPADSKLIRPIVLEGRWLTPQDENAIVIGPHLLKVRPDLKVGDTVVIKINNKETTWRIVGRYQLAGNDSPPPIYANYEYLSQQTGLVGRVSSLRVITAAHDPAAQKAVKDTLEALFKQAGMEVSSSDTGAEWRQGQVAQFDVLINFMMVMALLVAVVGALGLAGTMSMNILERIREIGVMRAIGASSAAIFRLVMVEGLLIGLISWGLAFAVAIPITVVLNQSVGTAVLTSALGFAFGWEGITFWLAVVVLLSALSSLWPAWNATRLTVREVLAYE